MVQNRRSSDNAHNIDDLDNEDDEQDISRSLTGLDLNSNLDFNAQKEAFEKEFIIKALKTFKGRLN